MAKICRFHFISLKDIKVRFFFLRESEAVFGNQGLQVRTLFQYVGPFCLLWMLTNYSYVRALGVIPAADVTALFSSCNAFVYIFSLIWLKESLGIIKVRLKCLQYDSSFHNCIDLASNGNKAGGGLISIQTTLLFLYQSSYCYAN